MDKELQAPCLKITTIKDGVSTIEYKSESFIDNEYLLSDNYKNRLSKINDEDVNNSINFNAYAAICPDFLLN